MTDKERDRINRAEEIQRYTENRCESLEKENEELKAQIQEQQVIAMQKIADKELKIVKLEEQIEKMKCCENKYVVSDDNSKALPCYTVYDCKHCIRS